MALKDTLAKKVAPVVAAATVMLTPAISAEEQPSNVPKFSITAECVQNPNNWKKVPEEEMRRFEFAAALASSEKKENFSLDGQSYNTKYVQEFIAVAKATETTDANTEFIHDVLLQSAKSDQLGKCFGKSFSSGADVFNVMFRVQQLRRAHTLFWDANKVMIDGKLHSSGLDVYSQSIASLKDILSSEFEYKGKKYDLTLDMPLEKQWKYFQNLNEEFNPNLDIETKTYLRSYVGGRKNSEKVLARLYKLMEVSGYPAIRPVTDDKSLVGLVTGDTAHFTPDVFTSSGTLYLPHSSFLSAELAHAFRNKNNTFGESVQFVRDGLKDILTFNNLGFTKKSQGKNYSDSDKMEYDTHHIVEPALEDFLAGRTPTIEQMYAQIDKARKKEGISYAQTVKAGEMTQEGYRQIAKGQSKHLLAFAAIRKYIK